MHLVVQRNAPLSDDDAARIGALFQARDGRRIQGGGLRHRPLPRRRSPSIGAIIFI